MSILALRRSNAKFVEEVRGYHADAAPTPVTTPAPRPRFKSAYPGVAVDAMRQLRNETAPPTPQQQIRTALDMAFAPLLNALAEPAPRTDRTPQLTEIEHHVTGWIDDLNSRSTRALDRVANDLYTQQWQLFESLGVGTAVTA